MSVELKTYAGSNVTPQNDAIKDDFNTLSNGIYYGCTVTIKDATTLHITAGQGIVYGRVFEIVDDDISVSLAPSGTLLGQLYLHIDLANLSAPAQLLVETGASLTPMIDDDQININSGITEMQLATFDVSTVTISNLVSTAPNARGAKDTIGNTNISGIGDGTVTGAISTINANLSLYEDVTSTTISINGQAEGSGTITVTSPNGKAPTGWSIVSTTNDWLGAGIVGITWANVGNVYTGTLKVFNIATGNVSGTITLRISF